MTMEVSPGQWAVRLGRAERWIAGTAAAALVAGGMWMVTSMQAVLTQLAVVNQQLVTINAQMADVPTITRKAAELEVRMDRAEADIRELRRSGQ